LGLLIGFGLGWLTGKDMLLTFFQGLRKPGGSSAGTGGPSTLSSMTGSSSGSATGSVGGMGTSTPATVTPGTVTPGTVTSSGTNGNTGPTAGAPRAGTIGA
jgi:hypothetical protein